MSVNGGKSDLLLQMIAQNITEHQIEESSNTFFLLYLTLGIVFCTLLSYFIIVDMKNSYILTKKYSFRFDTFIFLLGGYVTQYYISSKTCFSSTSSIGKTDDYVNIIQYLLLPFEIFQYRYCTDNYCFKT